MNEEWITSLFKLEEQDRVTLGDPVGKVVEPGGQVYLAVRGDTVLGCAALIRFSDGMYELAKMAVSPEARGLGIGRGLLTYVLEQAIALGAHTVYLGSSTKLPNAVHLYESLGFCHVAPSELPVHYERANVWMKFELQKASPRVS